MYLLLSGDFPKIFEFFENIVRRCEDHSKFVLMESYLLTCCVRSQIITFTTRK